YGYFKSNDTNDRSKYTIDNLIAILMNLEVYRTYEYDYEYQINALRRSENIMGKILEDFNISNGLILNYSRNWSIKTFGNQSYVNSLGIISLLELSQSTLNETYIGIAENISNFLWKNFYDNVLQGLNDSISDTTKYLETNSWAIQAFLKLYEKTQNVTYYLQGRNISYFINNHLWDVYNKIYNYSMDSGASAQNSTKKSTRANSIAILGLLEFRFPDYYLTRANTTMRLLLEHTRPDDVGFYTLLSRDHDQYLGSEYETVIDNFLAILALTELSSETNLTNYLYNTSIEIYNRINSTFYNSTIKNSTEGYYIIGVDHYGEFINQSSLIENTYALLALSELYKLTNNSAYLQEINKTWHYINNSLWHNATGGYNNTSLEFGGQTNRNCFDHFLIILANLEVANVANISGIYPSLEGNATKMANITLQIINNNMWDNQSGGFYTSANTTWGIDSANQNKFDAKRLDSNSLSIIVHSRYLELYPGDINSSLYSNRTNNTLSFIENTLWDSTLGGFFDYSNHNGTIIGSNKSTSDNCWAMLAYSKLFENTNNYTYYSKSEEILNFLNLYLWDYESGGYFTGYYKQKVENRNLKTPFSEFMAIRSLVAISKNRDKLSISPLINIQINSSKLDSLGRYIDSNIIVFDTDGNKLENASVEIFLSGFVDNIGFSPIYGLGQKFNFTSKNSNIYNFNLNFSPYYGRIYINPLILNESYGASWNVYLSNRTFSTYISRVFATLGSLLLSFFDPINYGFYNTNGTNLNKSAEENFLGIYTTLDFISSTGLNLAINWQFAAFDQIMLNYSDNATRFMYNEFSVGNSTHRGFISKTDNNGSHLSNYTQCKDNAWAVLAFLKIYELTNYQLFLDVANATWNYLNLTFWDNKNGGYNSTNTTTSQDEKSLYDNFLAILANLKIGSTSQINQTIRNQALALANFTLNETVSKLWDSSIYGFYSNFNHTWQPIYGIDEKSTIINSLAILTMIEYLRIYPNATNYYTKINQTSDFMLNYLWDSGFLGFFSHYNGSVGINNTNKTLKDNSFAILAFSELYEFTNNYTHYINAEKTSFFINSFFWDPGYIVGVYTNKSSIYGYIDPKAQTDTYSLLSICRALIKLYSIRLNLKNPPEANNFTVEQKITGKIEDLYEIEIEIFDDANIPLHNATAFAIVNGIDQIFKFNNIVDNSYKTTVNVSRLSFTIYINVLIFNESSFTAGFYTFEFYRKFPIYIQIAQDTLAWLTDTLWTDLPYADGFLPRIDLTTKYAFNNFMMLESI
ncbi:MAG: AGE family epimerase/isomerase, partial [Candidatus Helarchaeota archaeon]|nr:AGE family epimerase/isomerase [Candidatus Helarchaeota archaeon]